MAAAPSSSSSLDKQVGYEELERLRRSFDQEMQLRQREFETTIAKERELIDRERTALEDEKQRAREALGLAGRRVRLNVGGHVFLTTTTTLTRRGDSMLASMFSGRWKLSDLGSNGAETATSGADDTTRTEEHFIDRDGTHFRYILNFLRDGSLALPTSFDAWDELVQEAQFYGIDDLVQDLKLLQEERAEEAAAATQPPRRHYLALHTSSGSNIGSVNSKLREGYLLEHVVGGGATTYILSKAYEAQGLRPSSSGGIGGTGGSIGGSGSIGPGSDD